jgi:hypothetical protein
MALSNRFEKSKSEFSKKGSPMTDLEKAVRRRTRHPFAHYRRRIIVILEPEDILAMRLEGTRTVFRAEISAVYRQLVEWHVSAIRREKQSARKKRRRM